MKNSASHELSDEKTPGTVPPLSCPSQPGFRAGPVPLAAPPGGAEPGRPVTAAISRCTPAAAASARQGPPASPPPPPLRAEERPAAGR